MADKIDQFENKSNSPDTKKEAELLVVDVQTKEDLARLADDVLDPELKKVFDKIDGEKDVDDGQDKLFVEVQDLVHDKKYVDAAAKVLSWLSTIFFKSGEKPGLHNYKNLDDDLDLTSFDDAKLYNYIHDIAAKIDTTSNYTKKLKYTYLLSLAKDYMYKKEHTIELDPTAPRQCLQHELQPGNIILLNKGDIRGTKDRSIENKIATTWLQDATDSIWLHAAIISKIENGVPYMIHSTGDIGTDGKGGVDEVRLDTYLQRYTATDVLVLSGTSVDAQKWLTQTVDDIRTNQMGKEYDDGAAIAWLTGWLNNKIGIKKEDNNKVNCVEILAETMAKVYTNFQSTEHIKTPKEFLLQQNLKPVYLRTIQSKNI